MKIVMSISRVFLLNEGIGYHEASQGIQDPI
jgi:hypothetical protein